MIIELKSATTSSSNTSSGTTYTFQQQYYDPVTGQYYYPNTVGPTWITPNIPAVDPYSAHKAISDEFEYDINVCEHAWHQLEQEKSVKHICLYCRLEVEKKK